MAASTQLTYMSAAEAKQQYLEDLQLQAIDAGIDNPPMAPGSEWDLDGTGVGNAASVLIANSQLLDEDADPDRATGAALDEWRIHLELPEVLAAPAAGDLTVTIIGTGSVPAGLGFQAPNGFVGTITSGTGAVSGAVNVAAQMTTTGPDGNLPEGTRVRLVGGPPNLQTEAVVVSDWTGGSDNESDERKRERIKNRIHNAGSNWGDLRDKALESTGAISNAFVYQALGGPGSVKVAVLSDTSTSTRAVGSATVADVQAYLDAAFPDGTWKIVVQSGLDAPYDIAIGLALPSTGRHRWLASAPTLPRQVTALSSETSFTITTTYGMPSVGETIANWDPDDQSIATAKVLSVAGGVINTTAWSGGAALAVGRWIFPACDGIEDIVTAWLGVMKGFGTGEMLATTDPRYPFARRQPLISGLNPVTPSNAHLNTLQLVVPEATNLSYAVLTGSFPVPAVASDPPLVITLNRFGICPI